MFALRALNPAGKDMSDAALEFLNSTGLARAVLTALTSTAEVAHGVAQQLWKRFEQARPNLLALSENLRRFEQLPPVLGYEELADRGVR